MKTKLIFLLAILISAFFTSCNRRTWPTDLGAASFASRNTWTISGNGITQIWSDAVQTVYCSNKTSFENSNLETENFNTVNCRSNPGFPGDLFSWGAMFEIGYQLCPRPWRVPTQQDFVDLDIIMGGTGNFRIDENFVNANYIERWGGAVGSEGFSMGSTSASANYWAMRDTNAEEGFFLRFDTFGRITPRGFVIRSTSGFSLRCIR